MRLAVGARNEALGGDAHERPSQHLARERRLPLPEQVDEALDGLGCVQRVKRADDEVAGLGGAQGGHGRLLVAHLADQDHVGVLAQRRAQSRVVVGRVEADLALADDGGRVGVQVLDRVLDGQDVQRRRSLIRSISAAPVVLLPRPSGRR